MDRIDFGRLTYGMEPLKPGAMEQMRADTINKQPGHLNEEDGYDCPLCLNRGYSMVVRQKNDNFYFTSVPCKCESVRKNIRRMKRSGLENLIQKCKFDNYVATEDWQKNILREAKAFADEPEGWFYLGGQSGAGKTHLCTAICRQLLLNGRDVLYMLWRDESSRLKGLLNSDAYNSEINKFKTIDVLYIDDLFKTASFSVTEAQKPSQGDVHIAFEILNFRINNKLTTIISSENTLGELIDIDEATGGRIAEGSHTFSIGRDRGKNYRLRNMKEW